ncbi:reprolysin-like metallopeptidase [Emticicia sp.]|uniref:reprolysin-like metallopeptidase n=1 Tax=Emticicia sp. TaxID=1930953 RepID=UPI003752EAD6
MKKYILLLFFTPITFLFAQNEKLTIKINLLSVQEKLKNAPKEISILVAKKQSEDGGIALDLPMADGSYMTFKVIESPLMSDELAKRFPDIKTYRAFSISEDKEASGLFTVAPSGVYGLFFTAKGNVIIAPKNISQNEHEVFYQNDLLTDGQCEIRDEHINTLGKNFKAKAIQGYSNGGTLRTYRMSILTTGEFYASNGGTLVAAQAAVVSIVNSLKAVYEKEVSVSFMLVNTKIYTDATTDPFNGSDALKAAETFGALATSDPANFALSTYDIGHVLHGTSGGGVAYLNGPCRNFNLSANPSPIKAGGWSGSNPSSFSTFIHEVGHQFSAGHTFNSINDGCTGNIMTGSAYEPGSGSTYMSYWGNCTPDNISGSVNRTYFHTNSLESIISYSISTGTCSVNTATGNTAPVVNANPNGIALVIPKGTPFTLIGSGTDANGETILYNWEQYNLGTTRGGADDAQSSTDSPIFRSVAPSSTGNIRMFPTLATILSGSVANNDEALPQVARTINMRLTGRDSRSSGGGVDSKDVTVTVDGTKGPLAVTLPNGGETWTAGNTQTVNWSVNSTNLLSTNVDIYLSVDGGSTFPYLIVSNTPNDGIENYLVSANIANSTQARVKVISRGSSSSNFFDISNANFTLTSTCQPISSIICSDATVSAQSGNASLNLGLTFTPVSKFIGSSRAFSTAGAGSFPVINYTNDTYTVCQASTWGNSNAVLVKFRVSQSGTYTVSSVGNGSAVYSIFSSATFNCNNFVGGNSNGAISNNGSRNIVLNACTSYYALLYNINETNTSITFSVQGTGDIYEELTIPVGYSYTYMALNTTTSTIAAQNATSNFTTLAAGNFEVYGVMYKNGVVPTSFVGQSLNAIISANCLLFSDNKKILNISPNPCASLLPLSNPTDNISSGNITKQASATNGTITATNFVTGAGTRATYQAKNIQLNAGFKADSGTIFKAEIGGCN